MSQQRNQSLTIFQLLKTPPSALDLSRTVYDVLVQITLCWNPDYYGDEILAPVGLLAERTGYSQTTVADAIEELEANGLIKCAGKHQTSNYYILNTDLIKQSCD